MKKKELRQRIEALENQLRELLTTLGEALRSQLAQAQGVQVPVHPDQLRLGILAEQEAGQTRTNLVPRLLRELPVAPGGDVTLIQEGSRLCAWAPATAQIRFDWADQPASELVRVQWMLVARHGPVELPVGDPIRGSAFFGDAHVPVHDGAQIYVGGDVLFAARVYLDERAAGRILTGCQVIVHHAGSSAMGGT